MLKPSTEVMLPVWVSTQMKSYLEMGCSQVILAEFVMILLLYVDKHYYLTNREVVEYLKKFYSVEEQNTSHGTNTMLNLRTEPMEISHGYR